jgi:hypothetical protein
MLGQDIDPTHFARRHAFSTAYMGRKETRYLDFTAYLST